MSIVIFDLDRTLLDAHSGFAWVRHEVLAGRLGLGFTTWIATWLVRERLGLSQGWEEAYRRAVKQWAGQDESELRERSRAFAEQVLVPRLRPGARSVLATHRRYGDRLVLATASPEQLGRPLARAWGLELVASTELETRDGKLTGRIASSAMGEDKRNRVLRWAAREGIDLSTCHAYTDSWHDIPLLEAVGKPVVVNPDAGLARIAKARQWEVVDWGRANLLLP